MSVLHRPGKRPYFYKFLWKGRQIRKFGFKTEAEAKAAEDAKRRELEILGDSSTFATLCERRLSELDAYGTHLWYINSRGVLEQYKCWYALPVNNITPQMVRDKLLAIAKERGSGIANRHLVVLKSCFNVAVRDGELLINPVVKIKKFPTEKARKVIPAKDQIMAVLAAASELDRAYLTVIWLTGARVGEVNSLTWEDVNLERRRLLLWTRKKALGNRSPRNVYIINQVADALRVAYENRVSGSPWVFTNPEMARRYPSEPEKWRYIYRDKFLKTLCRNVGAHQFSFHCLRHHTASALDQAGVPLVAIQNILGHERASTTDGYLQDLGRVGTGLRVLEEES